MRRIQADRHQQRLHLLREDSIERAVASFPDAAAIYQRNIDALRALGWDGWRALWT